MLYRKDAASEEIVGTMHLFYCEQQMKQMGLLIDINCIIVYNNTRMQKCSKNTANNKGDEADNGKQYRIF